MNHTGLLFLSKTRPTAGPKPCGAFELQLLAYDRTGQHQTTPWRITWAGPAARRFWDAHHDKLTPGAALDVSLTDARQHLTYSRPPLAEMQARVLALAIAPPRHTTTQTETACTPTSSA